MCRLMAKNLRAGLRQSIKASRKASLSGSNVFGSSPLDLRFALQKTLDPRITFTRASTGTFVGSDGLLQSATTNEARFAHNPTTGESLGLLVEEARTNLLLNSATLSTQSVTVAAAANTLSFYGTGTVTLTGVSTAGPLVGTGANNRVSLTFTPTAGVLILTVSGSVTNAQLEAGAFPTSYIPTTTATVTRAADVASITGSNFSSFYNQTEGTVFAAGVSNGANGSGFFTLEDGSAAEYIRMGVGFSLLNFIVSKASGTQSDIYSTGTSFVFGSPFGGVAAYAFNNVGLSLNGGSAVVDTTANMPSAANALQIGFGKYSTYANGTIKRLTYWPVRLADPTLQAITQP